MNTSNHHANQPCGAGCGCCAATDRPTEDSPFRGGRFALACAAVFLLPLGLAVAGAAALRDAGSAQLAGGVGGLVLGGALAGGFLHRLKSRAGEPT